MSYVSMAKTLANGEIPGVALSLAKTKINDALGVIYDETDWSFQSRYGGWLNPGLKANTGTVTVTPYSDQVIADATATAAWAGITTPLITLLQFRTLPYSLYNIIGYDTTTNAPFATLTLDRPWLEPVTGAGISYLIYQAYFAVPVQDFRKFLYIMDTTFNAPVSSTKYSLADLATIDPQRIRFGPTVPTYAIAMGADQRPQSSTLGYPMFEIWPHNLSLMPYTFGYKRRGPQLVNPADEVPAPLTDELVLHRAREILYLYKMAQRGEELRRGSGADWAFLSQASAAEYNKLLKQIRAIDANLHQDFVTRGFSQSRSPRDGYSTNVLGQLNVGRWD